ncbi:major facilitator superfamily domain-containing protein [Clohesyomyces aquaticus]|uniref:Major facilitator superfamily domain-containing protein n=1 Tax=Clohesyomyces aquaticus TaxID=1231657 RepID=A0A1Y1ZEY7_9PLEO|nr:major facilitator superfamily domain-containing protein [Clohesyomyces aquaticus]
MASTVVSPQQQRRWFPRQWRDRVQLYDHLQDFDQQKQEAYDEMDKEGFGYWTVLTAGAGFFTGAYDVYAVNTVVPLLSIVYWNGKMPPKIQLTISMATLIGILFGQVAFGIMGDRYGRKKMFYRLLAGLIIGTIIFALISRGAQHSLNILSLIIFWRIWTGFFLGGDYPLSAAITAEFSPKKHRGRMLAAVFYGQPLGQITACIVSLSSTAALRNGITGASQKNCTGECLHSADVLWRWIVGFGAVPAGFALLLRFYIPESPRWLLEVERNPMGIDAAAYGADKWKDPLLEDDVEDGTGHGITDTPLQDFHFQEQPEQPEGHQLTNGRRSQVQPGLESWRDFWKGFRLYLFKDEPWTWNRLCLCLQFRDKHFFDGSWTDLAGLALSWWLLDFGFYFLIVNSFKLMTKIWAADDPDDVYIVIFQYGWRIIASTSLGAVVGGAIFIAMARNRWKLQLYGFLVLFVLFVVAGIVFIKLFGGRYFAIFIALYCLCHLAFNVGPNTSTFVIAAEVFPTKYRATCHGISAAAGKFGSVLTQILLSEAKINGRGVNDSQSHWLGWALIIQAFMMLLGAIVTLWCVPNPCGIDGKPRSLEDLGKGKEARQKMEREERLRMR